MTPFSLGTTRLRVRTGFERQVVSALRGRPDLVIDTSLLTAADLKCSLIGHAAFDAVVCAILPRPLPTVGASRAMPSRSSMRACSAAGVGRQTSSADPDGSRFHKR